MYLHLGQDTVTVTDEIVGIFDLDNTTVSAVTRDYLARAQREGDVVTVSPELPKSFVLCDTRKNKNTVYISPVAVSTLKKRIRNSGGKGN